MSRFAAPIAEQIWDMKYRFKDADGTPRDVTVEDSWRRIARDLAQVEKAPEKRHFTKRWRISNSSPRAASLPGQVLRAV